MEFRGKKMLLYHGSNIEVSNPQILESDRHLVFGKRFFQYFRRDWWNRLLVKSLLLTTF